MKDDAISRQDAIDALDCINGVEEVLKSLPPVQPEIIRCKDCKHWNLQVGNVKGDGLGSCDFHNVNLVTGEGFCYWAEKRGEENA